jgi:hypothetical protein
MTAPRPCYRHPRSVWISACPECTAWHLPAARARRDELAAPAAARSVPPPEAARVPPAHLHLVA